MFVLDNVLLVRADNNLLLRTVSQLIGTLLFYIPVPNYYEETKQIMFPGRHLYKSY